MEAFVVKPHRHRTFRYHERKRVHGWMSEERAHTLAWQCVFVAEVERMLQERACLLSILYLSRFSTLSDVPHIHSNQLGCASRLAFGFAVRQLCQNAAAPQNRTL